MLCPRAARRAVTTPECADGLRPLGAGGRAGEGGHHSERATAPRLDRNTPPNLSDSGEVASKGRTGSPKKRTSTPHLHTQGLHVLSASHSRTRASGFEPSVQGQGHPRPDANNRKHWTPAADPEGPGGTAAPATPRRLLPPHVRARRAPHLLTRSRARSPQRRLPSAPPARPRSPPPPAAPAPRRGHTRGRTRHHPPPGPWAKSPE